MNITVAKYYSLLWEQIGWGLMSTFSSVDAEQCSTNTIALALKVTIFGKGTFWGVTDMSLALSAEFHMVDLRGGWCLGCRCAVCLHTKR